LVLIVEGQPAAARPLQIALQPLRIDSDVIAPSQVPTRISDLEKYQNVTLLDVSAGDLSFDQMATLREFVRSEGRGLVAAGGRSSFTLGSYKDTPLEQALPVQMTPPKRGERPEIDMLLIIDQSASMGPDSGDSKFNMAKEAAILTTESLRQNDRIGVLAFDINQQWVVNFTSIGSALSLAQVQAQISGIPMGGGTDIYGALEVGLPALASQPGPVRHAILLTDGRSFTNNRQAFETLVTQMHSRGVTLSAIAIGTDADTELLRVLAKDGTGRYHLAASPADIPRLTLLESDLIRSEPQVEGDFRPDLVTPHPTLSGFAAEQLPGLQGYVATMIKPEAELVLQSPQQDPILAAWQYGLGRAVAWTPGIEAPWAANWSNWPDYGRFWAGLIRYTLPEPDSGPLQVRVVRHGTSTTLSADLVGAAGEPIDLADVQVSMRMPDGSERIVGLRQVAPGRYAQDVTLPEDGAYALAARAVKGDLVRAGETGYVQGYLPEYRPVLADQGDPTRGAALLDAIRAASTGDRAQPGPVVGGPGPNAGVALMPWLLGLAALLWPLEVAVRRGWIALR
jgi:Mg-chelatase subunit ChlD